MATRQAITDLVSLRPRPRNTLSSLRNRGTNPGNALQRRHNSTKTGPNSSSSSASAQSTTVVSPPPSTTAEAATAAAGAASPPLTVAGKSRSVWEIVKAGPIGRFGQWYTNAQMKRPYATQVASSFIVYLAGDLSAQLLFPTDDKSKSAAAAAGADGEDKPTTGSGYDPLRTLRHLTVGVTSSIPAFKWFMFLHHNFNYSSKLLSILTKTAVQQAVFTPVFNTYFFSMQSLLSGASLDETLERLKKALPQSIFNSLKLWPAVTAFSFMYVPAQFRAIFGGTIAVGWQTYLSWLNQMAAREVAAVEAIAGSADELVRVSQAA